MNKKMTVGRLAELSVLTAAALIIFVAELQFPELPMAPGMKLGLANIITVFCVYRYRPYETALVVAVRVFLGALFASGFSAIIFSAAGAFLCLAGMIPLSRIFPKMPMWVCSVIGAALHNIGQVAAAVAVTGTFAVVGYLPVLIAFGCAAGAFTGVCAQLVSERLKR